MAVVGEIFRVIMRRAIQKKSKQQAVRLAQWGRNSTQRRVERTAEKKIEKKNIERRLQEQ